MNFTSLTTAFDIATTFFNKSSAVAEIGDRGHNRHGPKSKRPSSPPLLGGELGPHLTQCGLGRGLLPYKWHLHPSSCLATIDMNQKLRGCALFLGGGRCDRI